MTPYIALFQSTELFASQELALEYFNFKASACKFGLVGWSVSYPRRVGAA